MEKVHLMTVGPIGAGKRSLCTKWLHGEIQVPEDPAILVEGQKNFTIDGLTVLVHLTDQGYYEKFYPSFEDLATHPECFLLCFNTSNSYSVKQMDTYISRLQSAKASKGHPNFNNFVIVECQIDRQDAEAKKISDSIRSRFENDYPFVSTSAVNGIGIDEAIEAAIRKARNMPRAGGKTRSCCIN